MLISSVVRNVPLKNGYTLSNTIIAEEGTVLAVKVLDEKQIYNQLELEDGTFNTIHKGDTLIVALGNRRALQGFVGSVPEAVKVGDTIQLLNLGGVAGICISENIETVGHALNIEVLGAIEQNEKLVNIKDYKLFNEQDTIVTKTPIVLITGTCMNSGKTTLACSVIAEAHKKGYSVAAAKMAGVAAMRDTLKMQSCGAKQAVSIVDAGYTSTVQHNANSICKGAIDYLCSNNGIDLIVVECGDGIFGEYGVASIVNDPIMQKQTIAHLACAHDPMGADKIIEVCKHAGLPINIISGPVTDNCVGIEFIEKNLNTTAINGIHQAEKLFSHLEATCLKK